MEVVITWHFPGHLFIQPHSLRRHYWVCLVLLCRACSHFGLLRDSKALCHFNMLCLSRCRWIKGDRSNKNAVQCCSKAVRVMKRMCVDDKAFDWIVLDIGSEWTRYDSLLDHWLFARCCTFCKRAIMLHIVYKFNVLPYYSARIREYRSNSCLHTVDGITT